MAAIAGLPAEWCHRDLKPSKVERSPCPRGQRSRRERGGNDRNYLTIFWKTGFFLFKPTGRLKEQHNERPDPLHIHSAAAGRTYFLFLSRSPHTDTRAHLHTRTWLAERGCHHGIRPQVLQRHCPLPPCPIVTPTLVKPVWTKQGYLSCSLKQNFPNYLAECPGGLVVAPNPVMSHTSDLAVSALESPPTLFLSTPWKPKPVGF